jgi:hypothetical protein
LSDWKQRKKFTDQFTDDSYIVSNHCGFNVLYIISCGGNIGNFDGEKKYYFCQRQFLHLFE